PKGYSFQGLTHSESDVPEVLLQSLVFRGQSSRVWPRLPESDLQTLMDSSEAICTLSASLGYLMLKSVHVNFIY
ncbi:hypothetical protein A2U01_0088310, partial [Trifolium medium]|nr:hypothetical protein [Trifolium medium]